MPVSGRDSVDVPENATPDELRECAKQADRIAANAEAEAQRFRSLSVHLRDRADDLSPRRCSECGDVLARNELSRCEGCVRDPRADAS